MRYIEVDPRDNNGQYRLLFLQVFCDDTVPGKTKDPAGLVRLAGLEVLDILSMVIQFDFEGPVSPTTGDGLDTSMVQSQAVEQVFDVPGCYDWVLDDRSVLLLLRRMREKVRQLF